MNKRLKNLSKWLIEKDYSFAFITSPPNIFYLTGFYCNPHERLLGLFVFQDEEPLIICPKMDLSQLKNCGWPFEIISYNDIDNPWELLTKSVQKRSMYPKNVAIEKSHLTFERAEKLKKHFPTLTFSAAEEKLNQLRMIKEENEIKILREAAKLADFGVEIGVHALTQGKTEMDILSTIEYELKKKGIREMSFATMVLAGEKTAAPHGTPGLTQVKKGDLVLFDLGVILEGYSSDITRTVVFAEINDKQQEIYDTVLKAQRAALKACKPGNELGKIDQAARQIINKSGYGQYFTHRVGHGLGIQVHEYPSMTETNKHLQQQGMVFTVEPGVYVPGIGGVRIEDDVLINEDGMECLTQYPKDLQIVKGKHL